MHCGLTEHSTRKLLVGYVLGDQPDCQSTRICCRACHAFENACAGSRSQRNERVQVSRVLGWLDRLVGSSWSCKDCTGATFPRQRGGRRLPRTCQPKGATTRRAAGSTGLMRRRQGFPQRFSASAAGMCVSDLPVQRVHIALGGGQTRKVARPCKSVMIAPPCSR